MKKAVFLKKISMTSLIDENGKVQPVTLLKLMNQEVLDLKGADRDGYNSVVYGFGDVKDKHINKPRSGYFKKLKKSPKKYLKEVVLSDGAYQELIEAEQEFLDNFVSLNSFEENDIVTISGKSKGKGFQGTIKAHNFKRGPMSHGSKNHRLPGSIGAGTDPARVFKGTRMAKRLGNKKVTIKNLKILKIDNDDSIVFLLGSVPGKKSDIVLMYK